MTTLRPVTLGDADAIADVMNAFAISHVGEPHTDADGLRSFWTSPPPWNLERDAVAAVDEDGHITGYGDIGDQGGDGTVLWLDVRGDPQQVVHDELERRARERAATGGVLRAVTYATETEYQAFLTQRGFRHVQTSYRMYVSLAEPPREVVWPRGLGVRNATADETALVHHVYQETFSEHAWFVPEPFDEFDHHVSNVMPDRSLWFVAEDDGEVAGIAICRPHAEGDPTSGWVSILAVRAPWRRRGLGEALLLHAFHEFRRRGLARVGLGVEADNATGAVRLYERSGMTIGWEWKVWETAT